MTGKLIPDSFPNLRPPGRRAARRGHRSRAFARLAREIGDGRTPEAVADGFLAIAVAKMAEAIKTISVARGYDVTRYALNCFGGAGGPARLRRRGRARASRRCSFIRCRRCCRPTAWGSPTSRAHRERGVERGLERRRCASREPREDARRRGGQRGFEAGRRARRNRHAPAARNCATRAPTPRWKSTSPTAERCAARSRRRTRRASASSIARRALSSRPCRSRRSAAPPASASAPARPRGSRQAERRRAGRASFRNGAWRDAQGLSARGAAASAPRVDGPALIIEAASDDRGRGRLARRDNSRRTMSCCDASKAIAAPRGDRREGRSGDAGDLQQSLHVDRRADGRDAAEHRLFRQHQGAARLLLRGVRRARAASSPTRRTCRCIWARWTARCETIIRAQPGPHPRRATCSC